MPQGKGTYGSQVGRPSKKEPYAQNPHGGQHNYAGQGIMKKERKIASSLINKGNSELRIEQIMNKLTKTQLEERGRYGTDTRTPESKQEAYEQYLRSRDGYNAYGEND